MRYYYKIRIDDYSFVIVEEDSYITYVTLEDLKLDMVCKKTKLIDKTIKELEEYFKGERKIFDIPVNFKGTPFQVKVWKEMMKIPYGSTLTYGELAVLVGNSKANRAIGGACHNNKLLILNPCHRVVAKTSLGGFGGGLEMKRKLLELEGVIR